MQMNETDCRAFANVLANAFDGTIPFPHLRLSDLSAAAQEKVGAHVIAMLKERDKRRAGLTDDEVYRVALEHFGIDCPHTRRLTRDYYPPGAWDCAICGSAFTPPQGKEGE